MALLPTLLLAAELAGRLDIPYREAYRRAIALERGEQVGSAMLQLTADMAAVRAEVQARLESAIETVVRPRRGRPRKAQA